MNIQSKSPRKINWKQIAIIAVVLGVAAFKFIDSRREATPQAAGPVNGTAQVDVSGEIDLDSELAKNGQSNKGQASKPDLKFKPIKDSNSASTKSSSKSSSGPFLKQQGGKKVSPAGLVYARSRIEHVMRHAQDQPGRSGNHGVFDVNSEDDVFRLLDEAYEMIKSKSREVSKDRQRQGEEWKSAYTINMKRRVGFRGGQSGNKAGKPPLSRIKLVLGNGDEVVTAYPY